MRSRKPFSRAASWFLYIFDRRRLYRAGRNLRRVFPQLPPGTRRRIARRAYLEFRRHQMALPVLARTSAVALCKRLTLHGWHEVDAAKGVQPARGIVFLGLTLGFFPLLRRVLELYCQPLLVLRGPLALDSELGSRVLGHIEGGGHVLAPCGFPTMSASAAALALAARAQTLPALAFTVDGEWHLALRPPLAPASDLGERYREIIAEEIERNPESWPWHLALPDLPDSEERMP